MGKWTEQMIFRGIITISVTNKYMNKMLTVTIADMQIKTELTFILLQEEWLSSKIQGITYDSEAARERTALLHCSWECVLV